MPRAIEWAPAAERDLRRLDHQSRERIRQAVYRLAESGQGDLGRIRGTADEWRLRVGDWRVRFCYVSGGSQVRVLRIRNRREAYRR